MSSFEKSYQFLKISVNCWLSSELVKLLQPNLLFINTQHILCFSKRILMKRYQQKHHTNHCRLQFYRKGSILLNEKIPFWWFCLICYYTDPTAKRFPLCRSCHVKPKTKLKAHQPFPSFLNCKQWRLCTFVTFMYLERLCKIKRIHPSIGRFAREFLTFSRIIHIAFAQYFYYTLTYLNNWQNCEGRNDNPILLVHQSIIVHNAFCRKCYLISRWLYMCENVDKKWYSIIGLLC